MEGKKVQAKRPTGKKPAAPQKKGGAPTKKAQQPQKKPSAPAKKAQQPHQQKGQPKQKRAAVAPQQKGAAAARKQQPQKKKGAAATASKPAAVKAVFSKRNPLIEARPKIFRIGQDLPPKRDLTRFVRWPWYIRLQRQKRILFHRLKVPPMINQFSFILNKSHATQLFYILNKIRPEEKAQRKKRRLAAAKALVAARKEAKEEMSKLRKESKEKKEDQKETSEQTQARKKKEAEIKAKAKAAVKPAEKPIVVKYGLNHVTNLIERNKAQLVVIAHDVDPIELVVWLPSLCRKKKIPFCIVKNKARLGAVVHKKTASVLAITQVPKEERTKFSSLVDGIRMEFNDNPTMRRTWGGQQLGFKRRQFEAKRAKILQAESRKGRK